MLTAENTTATPISISLSDGSRITLKSGSVLNYPRKFTKLSRTISFSGEAYFEIARDEKRPFVIESGKAITRVLGTKFNLRAYAKDTAFTVTVTEGLVAFGIDNKLVHVQKGETGKITISSGQVSRFLNTDPNFMAWKTGIFTFSDTRVDDALKQLSAFYGTSFVVETPELDSALFNFTSDSLSIQELIDNLEIALDAQIIRKENAYYIRQLN
jgi:ferric-dicitrate binding protein FerR (iron transport regulator)